MFTRRKFLGLGAVACFAATLGPSSVRPASADARHLLSARPASVRFAGPDVPATDIWAYGGTVPGPLLRYRVGDDLDVRLENGLEQPTTVHWHGLRPPVDMDGVPFISQPPTRPGEGFDYRFRLTEPGTYWYHPHFQGSEQIGRGLHGVLIVDEDEAIAVDREIVWVLDDWRMDANAAIAAFGAGHDKSHAGRIGNVVTVNGSLDTVEPVRAGERIRLRLVNVANARLFAPEFPVGDTWVVALDGHPVPPYRPKDGRVWLGPGERADLIVDMSEDPGATIRIEDAAYGEQRRFHLMSFEYGGKARLSGRDNPAAPTALRPHDLPEPDVEKAERHQIVFEGGAMGGMQGAHMGDKFLSMRELVQAGRFWAMNGTVPTSMTEPEPLLSLPLGSSQVLEMANLTAFPHPIHLHGHVFQVVSINGKPLENRPWRDTVLLWPDMTAEIAFVADNPGRWMFHCHILEHQESGMMAVVDIA